MNAAIVDDERLARAELRRLLKAHPDVSIVGEAHNVEEAAALLRREPVDLLLLDIQMPDGTGFDLLERLDRVPSVVMTTAYDEHAIHAFEINALDYLLKPIAPDRLAQALDRARRQSSVGQSAVRQSQSAVALDRVFVRDAERCWLIDVAEIRLFEAEGNYARVYFGPHRPLILRSLQALEARLNRALFFRVSRTHIINLHAVEGIETDVDGSLTVALRGGPQVKVSRRQSRRLRDELSL
ncbi:MAG TPA: LytTR family DNA-binding domain-containing protein [Vicinamibacterales bacterium]|jgi:two-component system LytT family response regulator|nr:LytTR family DNA-binding domain-containing protein [Vicinamibacterales bacterium]